MCASRSVKGSARRSRTSASTPMQRPARERSEQHSTRCGSASGLPAETVSFSTSGVRCACAMDSRRRCARIRNWVSGVAWPPPRTSVTFFSGTSSAPVPARRCSMVCCSSSCSSLAPSAFRRSRWRPAPAAGSGPCRARRRCAAAPRWWRAPPGRAAGTRAPGRAASRRRRNRGLRPVTPGRHTTASSASSCCASSRSAHRYTGRLPASSRCCPGLRVGRAPSSASSTILMRSGPVMVSVDHMSSPAAPEHGDAGGARQQRAQQPHVGLETRAGLAGDVLAVGARFISRNDADDPRSVNWPAHTIARSGRRGPCASWRIRAPVPAARPKH